MTNFQGFRVLPIKFSSKSTASHDLFLKEHSVRNHDDSTPSGRTLFILNVPPYATETSLKRVFSAAGKVHTVSIRKSLSDDATSTTHTPSTPADYTKSSFKIAYIVFTSNKSLSKALKMTSIEPLCSEKEPVLVGVDKWVKQYNESIYDHAKLHTEIEQFMKNNNDGDVVVDADEGVEIEGGEDGENTEEADENGWVTVTKKGRNPGISRKESVTNRLLEKNRISAKKKELKNFYTFQMKEERMKNIVALRKCYEESKEKVNAMKKMRNFRPY